jgi:hypothetical protein
MINLRPILRDRWVVSRTSPLVFMRPSKFKGPLFSLMPLLG